MGHKALVTFVALTFVGVTAFANLNAGGEWAVLSPLNPSPVSSSVESYTPTTLHSSIVQVISHQCKIVRKALMAAMEDLSNGPLIRRILEKNVDGYGEYIETLSLAEQNKVYLDLGETPEQQGDASESLNDRRMRRRQLVLARYDSAMTQTSGGISAMEGGNDYTRLLSQALLALVGQNTYSACDTLTSTIRNGASISEDVINGSTFSSFIAALSTPSNVAFVPREPGYIASLFNASAFEENPGLIEELIAASEVAAGVERRDEARIHGRVGPSIRNHPYFGPALTHRVPFNIDFTAALDASPSTPLKKLVHLSRTLSKVVLSTAFTHTLAIVREHFIENVYGYRPLDFLRMGVQIAEKPKTMVLEAVQELRDYNREGFDGGDESGGAIQGRFKEEDLWYGILRRQQVLYKRVRFYLNDLDERAQAELRGEKVYAMTEEEKQGDYHSGEMFPQEALADAGVEGASIMAYALPQKGVRSPSDVPHADQLFDAKELTFKQSSHYASDQKFLEVNKGLLSSYATAALPLNDIHRLLDVEDALWLFNPTELTRQRIAEADGRRIVESRPSYLEYLKSVIAGRVAIATENGKTPLFEYLSALAKSVAWETARMTQTNLDEVPISHSADNAESALLSGIPLPRSLFDVVVARHAKDPIKSNATDLLPHPQDRLWLKDMQFLVLRNTIIPEVVPISKHGSNHIPNPTQPTVHDEL